MQTSTMMQMFMDAPRSLETIIDIEFDEIEIPEGAKCQVQFYITPRTGFDAVGVDWGDGTAQDWPKSQYTMWHNWDAPGRYRVKFDERLKWFRFTEAWSFNSERTAVSRPAVYPIVWGDYVESAQGTFSGWGGSREGRGVRNVIPWGRSIRTTYCCYEACRQITGPFPKWGPSVTVCTGTFQNCINMTGPIPAWPATATHCNQCYWNTGATGNIPAWPSLMKSVSRCYKECKGLTGAWTDVEGLLMSEWIDKDEDGLSAHLDVVTDASDKLRALFNSDWGGTRDLT